MGRLETMRNRGARIVGGAAAARMAAGALHGFIWDEGRVTRLDVPRAVASAAYDISDRNQVVDAYIDAARRQHGLLYRKGRYTTIDVPRPLHAFAMGNIAIGINDRGEVVVPEPVVALTPPREDR